MKLTKVTKELIALLLSFLLLLTTGCQAAAQGDNSAQSKAGDDSAETGPLLARDPADALVGDHLSSNKNGYMSVLYYFGIEKNGDVKVWTYQNGSQEEAQTFQGLKVVEEWKDIVKIKNSPKYIIGLKADGSVCCVETESGEEADLSEKWSDAVDILAASYSDTFSDSFFACLKADGTVQCSGLQKSDTTRGDEVVYIGWDEDEWKDVVKISGAPGVLVGLRSDGTVIAAGNNEAEQCEVSGWTDVKDILATRYTTYGLKNDGTVISTYLEGALSLHGKTGIEQLVADNLCLRSDGTVCYAALESQPYGYWSGIKRLVDSTDCVIGWQENGQVLVFDRLLGDWKTFDPSVLTSETELVEIFCDYGEAALKADGTLVTTGLLGQEQQAAEAINSWDLFDDEDLAELAARNNPSVLGSLETEDDGANGEEITAHVAALSFQDCNMPIAAGDYHTVGLRSDGTVVAVGENDFGYAGMGQCNVDGWTDIVAVAAGGYCTVGLRANGTVVATGSNKYGQGNVYDWTNIVAIAASSYHTVGLRSDGTVVATGSNVGGQCDVSGWTDIVAVAAGLNYTVGLRSDGTVVTTGRKDSQSYTGECDVETWTDIVAISASGYHTAGLRSDGTVLVVGQNDCGECNVGDWTDIVAVSAGAHHTVGLRSDGTVVAVGHTDFGKCDVGGWTDIIAVCADVSHTIGLRSDGTVVAAGRNEDGQCNVGDWTDIATDRAALVQRMKEQGGLAVPSTTAEPIVTPYIAEEPQSADEPYTAGESYVAGNASVVASGDCGDAGSSLAWSLSDDGVLTISGSGRMKDYTHPQYAPQSSFDEWQMWDSAPWLYYDICTGADGQPLCQIRQVDFGEGITYVGECAFTFSHIQSVTFPEGLTGIGANAFCSSELTSVTLPSTLKTIGNSAFTGCRIASLTIPEGVTLVGGNAFGTSAGTATTGDQNMIILRQVTDVTILSKDCVIEDTGKEHNEENYAGWDNIYTLGDPSYTVIRGYPNSTAEAFARKWGYTFQSLDGVPEQTAAVSPTGKKLLRVEEYNNDGQLSSRTSYEYNDQGLLVSSVYRYYGNPWETECTYTYDGEGRLLNKRAGSDDEAYETDVFVRSYNDDGTLASSSYSGIQDMWTTEEYFYDENGLAVREAYTVETINNGAPGFYSFENSVDEQGNLTAIRHDEDSPEPRDAVFIYGPDGRMLQGYDEYWGVPITYSYVDDPYFCVRDETSSIGANYGGTGSSTVRVAYILDSAGKEIESFTLGTIGEMELTYDEDGYIASVVEYWNGYAAGETRFIYGDPADAPAIAVDAPAENSGAQVQDESGTLTITADAVNVRTGPGTEYDSLGKVDRGTRLPYTGKSGNWYRVEYNGMEAYIIEDYIMTDGGYYVQMASGTLSIDGVDVNVRTGPGTEYDSIGKVSRGVTLTVTGKSDNWYQVEYNGGTAYIIEDYVILNSAAPAEAAPASDSVTMDEAVLAATMEGDWSGFIGALAEQYGVMSTAEISMPEDWSSPTVWTGSDVTGLLSATVLDLDLDGQQELFTVRMDYFSDGGTDKDSTHLYLTVYEPGSGTPAAERVLFPGAEIVGAGLGAMCQFTVFTYDYSGVRYICLDDYTTMNETWTIVNFFSYDGSQLVFEGAGDYEEYGEGSVNVYRADTEHSTSRGFTYVSAGLDTSWQKVMSSHDVEEWWVVGTEAEKDYFKAYTDILAEHGLIADHDERIWINQTDDDRNAYCTLTAPDVYTVAEGELRPLAQAGRFYEYDSERNMLFVLHRTDCEGTLDSYR